MLDHVQVQVRTHVPVMMDIQLDIRVYTHYVYVSRKGIYTIYIYTSRVWKLAPNHPRTEKVSRDLLRKGLTEHFVDKLWDLFQKGVRFRTIQKVLKPRSKQYCSLSGGLQSKGTKKSRWSRVGTSKIILDFYPVVCLVR
jgi:hypothetical protein